MATNQSPLPGAGSCLQALAAVATVLPGRTLAEAGSSAALRTEVADDDAMAEDDRREDGGDTAMPCLLRLSRMERRLGRYPVTGGFLRLLEALLSRHCTDTQLQVRKSYHEVQFDDRHTRVVMVCDERPSPGLLSPKIACSRL